MANYYCTARSNYFRVKDRNAFQEFCNRHQLKLIENQEGYVGFLNDDPDGGGFCNGWYEEDGEFHEEDLIETLADHLVEGDVAVVMEAGAEKMRYLVGQATAVNSEGEVRWIDLNQIYDVAKELGETITKCEY